MTGPPRLHPEDRADFQAVLHLALSTPDIRSALNADPTGQAANRLRTTALKAADEITAAASDEYQEYVAVRTAARRSPRRPAADGTLLPALMVLTPPVSATSAAVLLVLGYLLQLADVQGTLPGSLVTAGWVLALVAAAGTLIALAALLHTAIRRRGGAPHADRLEQTRLNWQQALLDRGMLPHLRQYIRQDPLLGPAPPEQPPPGAPPADPNGASSHTH
ncbi:hypothetical protein [Streptomyces regalis]|uniref:Transmembrane protein n=1 Tax=Streptomyces regalis TaxID=68262 RepID=A0A0X3VI67_9ACTN|nr:hypothetical protein [Streptomyces regalis]KUL44067.1 hypothetical protein ADL12_05840 [Streptomyces regalis]